MGFLSDIVKGIGGAFGFGSGDKTSDVLEQQRALSERQNKLAEQRLAMLKDQNEENIDIRNRERIRQDRLKQSLLNQRLRISGIEEDKGLSQLQNPGSLSSRVF